MIHMGRTKHIPVLLTEAIESLYLKNGNTVVDATLGGGGHAREILKHVLPRGKVIALDVDREALKRFRKNTKTDVMITRALKKGSLLLVQKNFSALGEVFEQANVSECDAILADLGFSSDQIEEGARGFSFRENGPLDMRLDQSLPLTAEKIVNTFSQGEIEKILREYGDEKERRSIGRAIIFSRAVKPIMTTEALSEIIKNAYPMKRRHRMKIHPATKTFQALRIAVNRELEHLEVFLHEAIARLKVGGRLAVITFHSGEDILVKRFFKNAAHGCVCPPTFPLCRCGRTPAIKILTKKPLVPSALDVQQNPRSRSAKLRVVEKQ